MGRSEPHGNFNQDKKVWSLNHFFKVNWYETSMNQQKNIHCTNSNQVPVYYNQTKYTNS